MRFRWLLLSACVVLSMAWAQREQKLDSSLDPNQITWQEAKQQVKLYWCTNEIAVFPQSPDDTSLLARIAPAFAGDAEVVEKQGSVWILRSSERLAREAHADKVRSLRRQPGIKYAGPVFYEAVDKHVFSARVPTGRLIVRYLDNLSDPQIAEIETTHTLSRAQKLNFINGCIYSLDDSWEAIRLANALSALPHVVYAYPDCWRKMQTRSRATPDDPLFADQWHLKNTGQSGGTPNEDIAGGLIETVWDSYKGEGVVVSLVDDGVEIGHEDLTANMYAGRHHDYLDDDGDPTRGAHGTCCAGIVAARGFNGLGVCGIAPLCKLIGIALLGAGSDINNAEALYARNADVVDISSNSWGPPDASGYLRGPGPLTADALEAGIKLGRNGKGIIYCWACGNGGNNDNANYDGYVNSRYTIGVAASDFMGRRAVYSEKGADVIISAPSKYDFFTSPMPPPGILTVDRTGSDGYNPNPVAVPADPNYIASFNGTSAACPVAAGCITLLLQSNPNLTWRDVQNILIDSADQVNPGDSDWTLNGAGRHINHKYGFGRINVYRAIQLAKDWKNLPPEIIESASASPMLPIPDNNPAWVESTVTLEKSLTVEHVEVVFSASDHTYWPDLQVELVSPSGTVSVLAETMGVTPNSPAYNQWKFLSVRHWGENARGTWKLRVSDRGTPDTGTFQSWTLNVYGIYAKRNTTGNGSGGGCGATGLEFLLFLLVCAACRRCRK